MSQVVEGANMEVAVEMARKIDIFRMKPSSPMGRRALYVLNELNFDYTTEDNALCMVMGRNM